MRAGRSAHQRGRTGLSHQCGMVGGTRCLLLTQWGVVVAGACATANVPEKTLQGRRRQCEARMIVLTWS